jgi:3-oxoacyl-ACP synthase II
MPIDFTGRGVITSVGTGVTNLFDNLCLGQVGVKELQAFDPRPFRAKLAYELADRPNGRDRMARASELLLKVLHQAIDEAGLTDITHAPVIVGTGLRELRSLELWWRGQGDLTPAGLNFGSAIRQEFGARSYTVSNACAAGLSALTIGADLLALDEADTVVVAGVDVLTESMHGLLERVHEQAPSRVQPFDRHRKGVLMGDGAAAVVLQCSSSGQRSLGRLRATASNCDAFHVTAPESEGIAAAIEDAHRSARVDPGDVDLVMLHGTGTLLNDVAEATAMRSVFADKVAQPHMTAIKSMTGHTSGASGVVGLVMGLECLARQTVLPTVGLNEPSDEAHDFRLSPSAVHTSLHIAQVNAFGFGGVNAVAIVEVAE